MSPSVNNRLEGQLRLLAELYNAALQERRDAYRKLGRQAKITSTSQKNQLPEIKALRPELKEIGSQVLQDALERVDRAFQNFFARVKRGEKPGYPRFKSARRYKSLTFKQTGWSMEGRRLKLQGIGSLKLFWSRDLEGDVKTVTVKRDACGDWWVFFSCDNVPLKPLEATNCQVGLDLGLTNFAATSDGELVRNPRPLKNAEIELKRCQRKLSKRKKGGYRRNKQRITLARRHRKVERVRTDFHFKTARKLVEHYDLIAVESLNIRALSRGWLAKSVNDVAWGAFLKILSFKAAEAGRRYIKVNAAGTSQECSGCGRLPEVPKTLADRLHVCLACGLSLDRDTNAACNVLQRALRMLDNEKRGRAAPSGSSPEQKLAA